MTQESMAMVVRELDRMENIVRKLLYFSKERTPKFRDWDLHGVLDSALEVVRHDLRKKRITVKRFYTADPSIVPMDEHEIREVILNLLANAMEAMPDGGTISITTHRMDENVSVAVEDSGEGVQPAVAARIFDPFFTTKESGTGLGLSIAYEIIHAHQGTLEYVKTNGGGARFILSLPTMRKLSTSTEQP
ncbi:MAG: ATP-binding protein, partial [Bacteroidota bacterium]